MNEEEIKIMVRERLSKGILPRNLPIGIPREPGQLVEGYSIQLGGHRCSACDRDKPYVTYRYPDKEISFHQECERIWKEERERPIPK